MKNENLLFLFIFASLLLTQCAPTQKYSIIPAPKQLTPADGFFTLDTATVIEFPKEDKDVVLVVDFLKNLVMQSSGILLKEESSSVHSGKISFVLDAKMAGPEGHYKLNISPDKVEIISASALGLFYGVQTFRQLLPPQIESRQIVNNIEWKAPCVQIDDEPRFRYRGLHLDVARHFFPVSFIKKYIDLIALHKMNTFHWHLTEDQGWRIEIKKYPLLTRVGAQRDETLIGHGHYKPYRFDGKPYGGYYTQEEVKEVVKYARSRFVSVIPEIEMPGHSLAALAAYPELGCTGGPYKVATRWGIFKDVYCAGNEKVFEFMENVLSEVVELFPGKYIHIGGDECPKDQWKLCPKCQARIKAEGLKDEHELQSYFIKRIEKFLLTKGRNIIGWDEILEGGLAPKATVMSWRGIKGGIEAAKQKHEVIMSPVSHCYLNFYQSDPKGEMLAIGGFTTLKKSYSFEPVPQELSTDEQKYIVGVQGNVWTEYIIIPEHVEYMAFPRACALAEVGWTAKEKKDWDSFQLRLDKHKLRLAELFVNFFPGKK